MIPRKWFDEWKAYVLFDGIPLNIPYGDDRERKVLGPIPTWAWLDDCDASEGEARLRPTATLSDFECVPREAWDLLVQSYGIEGHPISRPILPHPPLMASLSVALFPVQFYFGKLIRDSHSLNIHQWNTWGENQRNFPAKSEFALTQCAYHQLPFLMVDESWTVMQLQRAISIYLNVLTPPHRLKLRICPKYPAIEDSFVIAAIPPSDIVCRH